MPSCVWIVTARYADRDDDLVSSMLLSAATVSSMRLVVGEYQPDSGGWESAHFKMLKDVTSKYGTEQAYPVCAGSVRGGEVQWNSAFNDRHMSEAAWSYARQEEALAGLEQEQLMAPFGGVGHATTNRFTKRGARDVARINASSIRARALELSREARERARAVADVPCRSEYLRAWVKSKWDAGDYETVGQTRSLAELSDEDSGSDDSFLRKLVSANAARCGGAHV